VSFTYWIVSLPLTGHKTRDHYYQPSRVASRLKIATWLWLALTVWLLVVSPLYQLQRDRRH
jgi:hypothetical protein